MHLMATQVRYTLLTGISSRSGLFRRQGQRGERQIYAQAGTCPEGAVEEDPAADRLHSVLDADQARTRGEVCTADTIVADSDVKDAVGGVCYGGDADDGCARMLGHVGQCLCDDVVGA